MGITRPSPTPLERAVRALGRGGQSAYARIVGKHQSTISERLRGNGEVRDDEVLKIAAATGIPKEQLRPDLYQPEADPAPPTDRYNGARA